MSIDHKPNLDSDARVEAESIAELGTIRSETKNQKGNMLGLRNGNEFGTTMYERYPVG